MVTAVAYQSCTACDNFWCLWAQYCIEFCWQKLTAIFTEICQAHQKMTHMATYIIQNLNSNGKALAWFHHLNFGYPKGHLTSTQSTIMVTYHPLTTLANLDKIPTQPQAFKGFCSILLSGISLSPNDLRPSSKVNFDDQSSTGYSRQLSDTTPRRWRHCTILLSTILCP